MTRRRRRSIPEIPSEAQPRSEPLAAAETPRPDSPIAVLWQFFVHVVVGTLLFILIYTPAVGLDRLVHYLTAIDITLALIWIVQFAEYSLVTIDTLLFIVFLAKTAWRSAKKL